MTSLDVVWKHLGYADISAIKIDVEGAELDVLKGEECPAQVRPFVLLEWSPLNLWASRLENAGPEQVHQILA